MGLLAWVYGGVGVSAGAAVVFFLSHFIVEPAAINAAVKAATSAVEQKAAAVCANQITANAKEIQAKSDQTLDDAMDADSNPDHLTPVDQAQLQDICNADPQCRSPNLDPKKATPQ